MVARHHEGTGFWDARRVFFVETIHHPLLGEEGPQEIPWGELRQRGICFVQCRKSQPSEEQPTQRAEPKQGVECGEFAGLDHRERNYRRSRIGV
jgi:hypothetical protein